MNLKIKLFILLTCFSLFITYNTSQAQPVNTVENLLHKDSTSFLHKAFIGGYGNAFYQRDFNLEHSTINLERFVLFTGYKFSKRISFFSELEVEDAKVSGGEEGGEVALEQCYVKFNLNPTHYFTAGLFLPRIGILNENHLPNSFNGNERTQVERYIIPSTWRELGVGFYGSYKSLNYSAAIVNGLNSEGFEHGTLIRDGRFEGREATANNIALTGALQFYKKNFKVQVSGYYGGSVGLAPLQADSLRLTSGFFGTPVILGEANVQYEAKGLSIKVLGTTLSIPDASDINRAYASNTPDMAYGAYAEVGYNVFQSLSKMKGKQLIAFGRYEVLDMNAKIPANGITDGTLNQSHIVAGLCYLPVTNVAIKADVRLMQTGDQNDDLIINPSPIAPPYEKSNTFFNLGIGFSF